MKPQKSRLLKCSTNPNSLFFSNLGVLASWRFIFLLVVLATTSLRADERPLIKDFLGLCTHTIQFRPDLYQPTARLARDYHPADWDIEAKDTSKLPEFPFAANRVNWQDVYGSWNKAGWDVNACLMFDMIKVSEWKDMKKDARAYGEAFAKTFGKPGLNLVAAAEIGNEPGEYDDAQYRAIFEAMAAGLRAGDPSMKIATCNMTMEPSHKYAKNIECVKGLEKLYDVINTHTYPQLDAWPTWRRSHPEDARLTYLSDVEKLVKWRDANAPGKPVWITEFGYDASTKQPEGDWKEWKGNVTDLQQAQYLVRSVLLFAAMPGVERAYIYWFNDDNTAHMHAAAGLTRNYEPKMSFHAIAQLNKILGDYRFERAIEKKADELYVYEFRHASEPKKRVWTAWSPTGSDRKAIVELETGAATNVSVEHIATSPEAPERFQPTLAGGRLRLEISESVTYVILQD